MIISRLLFLFTFLFFSFIRAEDYYSILGLGRNATPKEIKKAFFSLSKKYHPDKNNQTDKKYAKMIEAYETLKDSGKKREYDEELELGFKFRNNGFPQKQRKNYNFYEQEFFYRPHDRGQRNSFEFNFDYFEMIKILAGFFWETYELLLKLLLIASLGVISIFTMNIYYTLKN